MNKSENHRAPEGDGKDPLARRSQPAEEGIRLNKLFPNAQQDLDALFPDAGTKKLLQDVVQTRKQNERFVKKIIDGVNTEEDTEGSA